MSQLVTGASSRHSPIGSSTTSRPDSGRSPVPRNRSIARNGRGTASGGSESARAGSRSAITMPTTKITAATRSDHCGPTQNAASPIGATTAPANVP